MGNTPKDTVCLRDDDPNKGPNLYLWSEDADLVERFRVACYLGLPKSLSWFHQCSGETYHMFEFWRPNEAAMRSAAEQIAKEIDLPVLIELYLDY